MNELKRIFCLAAALLLLLCGCGRTAESGNITSDAPSSVLSDIPSKTDTPSKESSSSKKPVSSVAAPKPSSSQKPNSSKPLPSSSAVQGGNIPTGEIGWFYFDNLNDHQKQIYTIINTAVKEMKSGLIALGVTTARDVSLAFNAVRTDHPEYFWMPYSYINKIEGEHFSIALDYESGQSHVSYLCTKEQKKTMEAALKNKVAAIKKLIPASSTDYEIELLLHDWLCKNVAYIDSPDDTMRHTAYGALVSGHAVCEGYARAMQLLCHEFSIPCTLVCGISIERNENHMWNVIKIDGDWYNLDVTWDDDDHNNVVMHRFFNIPDSLFTATHKADPDFTSLSASDFGGGTIPSYNYRTPKCTAATYTYAAQANCFLGADLDAAKTVVRQKMKEAADKKAAYCEFTFSFDVPAGTSPTELAKKYALQNCKNDVNSNSKHKIKDLGVANIGRTFIVFLNYGG